MKLSLKSPRHPVPAFVRKAQNVWISGLSGLIILVLIVFSVWSSKPINIYFSYFFEDTSFRNALYQTASEYGFDLYHKGLSYKEVVL